ncbi:hypothetical protein K469DRAFT_437555, partial [Zopfia rhizophila CBS 207.26]
PEQLAQIPAGVPPLGVMPNLVNPPNAGNYIIIANSVLMAMMITFVALRFHVVFRIKRKMGADDWTVVAALIGSCYYFVVVCLGKVQHFGKSNDDATDAGSSCQSSQVRYPHLHVERTTTHHLALDKNDVLPHVLQLFRPLTWLRRCVYVGLAVVWAWYVSMCIAQTVITAPPSGHGWAESFATPRYHRTFQLCVPTASFSLVSDVYILV